MTGPRSEPGPLADEAARLVAAVQEWARRSFPASDAGHSASGGDCSWCPLCQFAAVLRGDRPEVTDRVAEAGTALVAAVRAVVDAASNAAGRTDGPDGVASTSSTTSAGGHHRQSDPPGPRVQRITLIDPS